MDQTEADVCVVGAGYAGLIAARTVARSGASVVVLEARDRVGGRVWTRTLDDGTALDMGGTWIGPGQDAVYSLAVELGIATYPTYAAGATVFVDAEGSVSAYNGQVPKIGLFPVLSLGQAMLRLDRMAKSLRLDEPWASKHAEQYDGRSAGSWIDANAPTGTAKELLRATVRGLLTAEADEVSLLHFLYLVRSSKNGLNGLLSIEGGYQQDRLTGGAQTMANLIAAELGESLRLGSPVDTIEQDADGVTVSGATVAVRAKRAVVSVPPALAARITFAPALPPGRMHLLQSMPAGGMTKFMCVYETPFWRADGRSGMSVGLRTPVEMTLDASPKSGRGVIAAFAFGEHARQLAGLPAEERRRIVLETLKQRFGGRAAEPLAFEETDWEAEEWTRGCSAAHMGTGVLTQYGPLLRAAVGRIHWAGSETATTSHLAIDGAVRSGQRAAAEVLANL